jgi:hypothetical protein
MTNWAAPYWPHHASAGFSPTSFFLILVLLIYVKCCEGVTVSNDDRIIWGLLKRGQAVMQYDIVVIGAGSVLGDVGD